MKKLIFTLFCLCIFTGSAYAQLNEYKYIIIPKRFEAFKKANQYLTSTLLKHLFIEQGYEAIYEDALPEELNNNRCLGLIANIIDESTMFATKTSIELKDCNTQKVYTTQQGFSKAKEFKIGYNEAIRQAFKSFDEVSYAYAPGAADDASKPVSVSYKNDVKQIKESTADNIVVKVQDVAKENEPQEEVKTNAIKETVIKQETTNDVKQPKESTAENIVVKVQEVAKENEPQEEVNKIVIKEPVVSQEATTEQQSYKNLEPKPSSIKQAVSVKEKTASTPTAELPSDVWYAQEIPNGFQLVDSSPKVRLKIFKSSLPDVYLAVNEKGNGLVYHINGQWTLEYYEGNVLKVEKLNLKF